MKTLQSIQEGFYKNTNSGIHAKFQPIVDNILKYSSSNDVRINKDHIEVYVGVNDSLFIEGYPDKEFGCKVKILSNTDRIVNFSIKNSLLQSIDELEFSQQISNMFTITECHEMKDINMNGGFIKSINYVYIQDCDKLVSIRLPFNNINVNEKINVCACDSLKSIILSNLRSTSKLIISMCKTLNKIDTNAAVGSWLQINNCNHIKDIGGIKRVGYGEPVKIMNRELPELSKGKNTLLRLHDISPDFDFKNMFQSTQISKKCKVVLDNKYITGSQYV